MCVYYPVIGQNLRRAREEAELTQRKLAGYLGCSATHYGRIERGEKPVTLHALAAAGQVLNVPVGALLKGAIEGEEFAEQPSLTARCIAKTVALCADGCSTQAVMLMLTLCREVARIDKDRVGFVE